MERLQNPDHDAECQKKATAQHQRSDGVKRAPYNFHIQLLPAAIWHFVGKCACFVGCQHAKDYD